MSEQLRKGFEAWARNHYYLQELSFKRGAGGDYSEPEMEAAWEVWQAAKTEAEWKVGNNDHHPAAWVPSKALKELERGMNNAPCILTDAPAEFNDTPVYRDPAGTIAALERKVEELRSLLSDVTCVAITMLYDTHKQDVLDEFTLDELKEVVGRSEHLKIAKVEHIYRRGFEALAGGEAG